MKTILFGAAFAALLATSASAAGADRIEIFPTANGQHAWRLVAANNEKLCVSETYKGGAKAMLDTANAAKATGNFAANYKGIMNGKAASWHLIAANKKDILCTGEAYTSQAKAEAGMKAAQKAFKAAGIITVNK
ncbi:MAG: DUF1508 domain-containing protein [Deltaproteobacteria bacterium]|nr:DUF1508 domain-containing protein [Deltaproteobacteria bacterium]